MLHKGLKVVRKVTVTDAILVPEVGENMASKDHEELMRQVAVWVNEVGGEVIDFQNDKIVVQGTAQNEGVHALLGDILLYNRTGGRFSVTTFADFTDNFVVVMG